MNSAIAHLDFDLAAPRSDPRTIEEWQEAADLANFWLIVDAAVQYGLLTTDARIDPDRCERILARARRMGIQPRDAAGMIERLHRELKTTSATEPTYGL